MSLLTTNTKLKKSKKLNYDSFGIHFSPATLSGKNVCPSASKGCIASCLNIAGYGAYNKVQSARIKKTKKFFDNKKNFILDLIGEIETQVRRSNKNNKIPTFRLNLTSDIAWESIRIYGKNVMEMFPHVQFYDYTKTFSRMKKFLDGKMAPNYHLTFSRSESNHITCEKVLAMGGNVAMVFYKEMPKSYMGNPVVEGLSHDLRFLDPKGCIVGLLALGPKAKNDTSGFVIR